MLPLTLTNGGSHAIALGVDQTSYLCEVAVSLAYVLNAGRLHEECVIRGEDSLDSLPVVFHQSSIFPATHESPHLFVRGDFGFLSRTKETKQNKTNK